MIIASLASKRFIADKRLFTLLIYALFFWILILLGYFLPHVLVLHFFFCMIVQEAS